MLKHNQDPTEGKGEKRMKKEKWGYGREQTKERTKKQNLRRILNGFVRKRR
jgi:hypothetical protein